jgi:hypothetical protein
MFQDTPGGERRNAWQTRTEYGHVLLNLIPSFRIFVSSIALNKEDEEECSTLTLSIFVIWLLPTWI